MKTFLNKSNRIIALLFLSMIYFLNLLSNAAAQSCSATGTEGVNGVPAKTGYLECSSDVWIDDCAEIRVLAHSNGFALHYSDCNSLVGGEPAYFTGSGANTYPYNVMESVDVVITKDVNSKYYILAVYKDPENNTYYLETFHIAHATTPISSMDAISDGVVVLSGNCDSKNIHIDANRAGKFAIVLANDDGNSLQTFIGQTGTTGPYLLTGRVNLDGYSASNYKEPDIAISEIYDYPHIFYAFTNGSDRIYVTKASWSDILYAYANSLDVSVNVEQERRMAGGGNVLRPRIACGPTEDHEDWTAVWEDRYTGASDIEGITYDTYTSSIYPGSNSNDYWVYTDDSQAPGVDLSVTDAYHQWPTVTYSADEEGIQIAWYAGGVGFNGTLDLGSDEEILGRSADMTGAVMGNSCLSTLACYEVGQQDQTKPFYYPSLSGKHGEGNLAYINASDYKVWDRYFKLCETFKHGHVPPKTPQLTTMPKFVFSVNPNPSSSAVSIEFDAPDANKNYNLSIIDITGKIQTVISGNVSTIKLKGQTAISGLRPGIYLVRIAGDTSLLSQYKIIRL